MKINKKQLSLISLIEKCGFLFRDEIDKQKYPDSMIDSLISKGLISEFKNKITSTTNKTIGGCDE